MGGVYDQPNVDMYGQTNMVSKTKGMSPRHEICTSPIMHSILNRMCIQDACVFEMSIRHGLLK